tara:strand:+ start:8401 stop:9057 length:657 start_codon:yes stop_codon:yes gene_type:complete
MLQTNWHIKRVWKNPSNVLEQVEFEAEFTDPDFPGEKSVHSGLMPLTAAGLSTEATREQIIDGISAQFGTDSWTGIENFHRHQLAFRYGLNTNEPIAVDTVVISAAHVDIEHDRRAAIGKTFTIAGYGDIPLEGSLRTQAVLLALKDTARDLLAAGVAAPVLFFTDRDNVDHNLTAAQVIDLVNAGKAFMQTLHEAKRALKAMDPVPLDYATNAEYWP